MSTFEAVHFKNASDRLHFKDDKAKVSASVFIERTAVELSSVVFVYDLAMQLDFGRLTTQWSDTKQIATPIIQVQTRPGGGLDLLGLLSFVNLRPVGDLIATVFTSPNGLLSMVQLLSQLPPSTPANRVIFHIPSVILAGDAHTSMLSLATLLPIVKVLSGDYIIILSSTPQESVELARMSYEISNSHIVHIFDHYSSTKGIEHIVDRPVQSRSNVSTQHALLDNDFESFKYTGDDEAGVVAVFLNGPFAAMAKAYACRNKGSGVITVRLYRPWNDTAFRNSLPKHAMKIYVFDDVLSELSQAVLYEDVLSTLLGSTTTQRDVISQRITPEMTESFVAKPSSFLLLLSQLFSLPQESCLKVYQSRKRLLFFTTPSSPFKLLHWRITEFFLTQQVISTKMQVDVDLFSRLDGIEASRIVLSQMDDIREYVPLPLLFPLNSVNCNGAECDRADLIVVFENSLFQAQSLLSYIGYGGILLIFTPLSGQEILASLLPSQIQQIHEKKLRVYRINLEVLINEFDTVDNGISQAIIGYISFLRLFLGDAAEESFFIKLAYALHSKSLSQSDSRDVLPLTWLAALEEIEFNSSACHIDVKSDTDLSTTLNTVKFHSMHCDNSETDTPVHALLRTYREGLKKFIFSDLWSHSSSLNFDTFPSFMKIRPDVSDRTYLVTCTVNRRLTPLDYDRNIIHLEFDTKGTGLQYNLGDALGVHGWNDTQEVLDFCSWYGLDVNQLVTIPLYTGDEKFTVRTVFQALQQQIDIFGRPSMTFYTDLASFASSVEDKMALQFVGSSEGSSTFQKLAEKDTTTFADVLWRYGSARPGFEALCNMVGYIKPRHYSIASAQSAVGDKVDLLIVTVDWVTLSGSTRFGQCTRYLAGLKVGQKVTVSIKPSVMKPPPDNLQPMILSGLGTGVAPFRAFLQHRTMLVQRGIVMGPLYYYFGSRHRSKEFIYEEEIEALIFDKIITRAGLAFSRDQKHKLYIQHKMFEDAEQIAQMLYDQRGVFYLCGPTWPVSEVHETLVDALVKHARMEPQMASEYLEHLKEEERYVLEVY